MKFSKRIFAVVASPLLLAGCDGRSDSATHSTPPATPPRSTVTDGIPAPDNTANNRRDRDMNNPANKTPMDQSNAQSDLDISARIRSAVMEDKSMSLNAQNCKIITDHGVVTLRGVVDTQAEKAAIEAIAQATQGVTRVDNQLEIKAQ